LQKQKDDPARYAAAVAERRAAKLRATPAWANRDHIRGVYELCAVFRRIGIDMHVDHIVPLQSDSVCGFHTEQNLQLLVASDNSMKGNHWWPDMATEY
jgi:5-methylcytosine-specific restriction endonuclease McrA